MIAALLTMLLAQVGAARPAEVPAVPIVVAPPADWSSLPELRYRRRSEGDADYAAYVAAETRAGRCVASRDAAGATVVKVDLAVLVAIGGGVRRIVPRAIGCPTVEQYATGLVQRLARDNLDAATTEGWYHTALEFTWRE